MITKLRRSLALGLIAFLVAGYFGRAHAATQEEIANAQSATYNNQVAPAFMYHTDDVGPFKAYFANQEEIIDPGNGILTWKSTDLHLPGRNGLDLDLTRLYVSQNAGIYRASTKVEWRTGTAWQPPYVSFTQTTYGGYYEIKTYVYPGTGWQPPSGHSESPGSVPYTNNYYPRSSPDCGSWNDNDYQPAQSWTDWSDWLQQADGLHLTMATYKPYLVQLRGTCMPGYYYDYSYPVVVNTTTGDTYFDQRNRLGIGWQWSFPSLEIQGSTITFHDGGASFTVNWDVVPSHLNDYPLKDLIFENDSGSFSNGQVSSRYKVTTKAGRVIYFGSDGRLLGKVDRYGNRITFQHTTLNSHPVISQITDSVGRVVSFAYTASEVTVTAPGNRVWRYALASTQGGKVLLSSATDPLNRITTYNYTLENAAFSFLSKNNRDTNNVYANLTSVTYPTGGVARYTYGKATDNLGTDGSRELFKVSARWDDVGGSLLNKDTYVYNGEPGGYPTYGGTLPTTYTYSSTMTRLDGTTVTVTYDYRHLVIRSEVTGTGYHQLVENSYAANRTPAQVKTTRYGANGATSVAATQMVFNDYNDLTSRTDALGVTATYAYDAKFHQLSAITQPQNSQDAVMKTEYAINATTGNIDSERKYYAENQVDKSIWTYFAYDAYGNRTQSKLKMADGSYRTQDFEYGTQYGSAYLTKVTETYTDATGANKASVTSYGYDMNTGMIITYVDPMGETTTATYDAVGRVKTVTFPQIGTVTAQRVYAYDDLNRVSQYTDENGHITRYEFDQLNRLLRTKRALGAGTHTVGELTYDTLGRLSAEKDANGNITRYTYDGGGRVTQVEFPDQTVTTTSYDDAGLRRTETDANGNAKVTTVDLLGRPVEVAVKPDKNGTAVYRTTTAYDYVGNAVTLTDAAGRVSRQYYDTLGRVTRYVDAAENEWSFTYDNAGLKLSETGPGARVIAYTYDPAGRLLTITNPLGGVVTYAYDAKGRRVSVRDANGNITLYSYDARDRLTRETNALGGTTSYTFDAAGNRLTVTDPRGNTTSYEYDEWNRVVKQTSPVGATLTYRYDLNGNLLTRTDPLGNATVYAHDSRNRVLTETNELGIVVVTYTYDAAGNRATRTDARGGVTTYTYDGLNRLIRTAKPLGITTTTEYDAVGNVRRKTDGRDNSLLLGYDSLNRLISATDPVGGTWSYTRDAYGNLIRATDPMGRLIREDTYDKLNRKVSSKDGLGNQTNYRYDAAGNLLSASLNTVLSFTEGTLRDDPDSNGIATGLQVAQWTNRDDTGTVTAAIDDGAQKLTVSNHGGGADGAVYDYVGTVGRTDTSLRWTAAAGDVFSVSVDYRQSGGDFGQLIIYYYAADGSLLESDYSPAFTRSATWKRQAYTAMAAPAGTASMGLRIVFRTNGTEPPETLNGSYWVRYLQVEKGVASAGPREFTYDMLNRLTGIKAAGGVNITLGYDAVGNRTSMSDGSGTSTYTYDGANHLLSRTVPDGKSIAYEHNLSGKVTRVTDYAGNSTQYTYDKAGRVLSATFGASSSAAFTYDDAGNLKSLTLPGGVVSSYTHDAADRMTSLATQNSSGATLKSYAYGYDQTNNVTFVTDGTDTSTYTYDRNNQLITEARPAATTEYGYDLAGNRTSVTDAAGTTLYTYDAAGRLTQAAGPAGTDTYVSDKAGNQVSDGKNRYEYDGLNRLTEVATGTDNIAYGYDGDGMLVSRSAGDGTTRFYLDGTQVINEGDGSGAITAAMFRGGGVALGRKVGNDPTAYYLYNGHGDVTGILDAAGTQLAAYDYDAFGKLTTSTGSFNNPYLYAGEYYDYTTAQYYLRARFYSPQLGRFTTQDSYTGDYADPASLNLYTYVRNNPLIYVDPTGHDVGDARMFTEASRRAKAEADQQNQVKKEDQAKADFRAALQSLTVYDAQGNPPLLSKGVADLADDIFDIATEMGVPPAFVATVIQLETGGVNTDSNGVAAGYMQVELVHQVTTIDPKTGQPRSTLLSQVTGQTNIPTEDEARILLLDKRTNLRVGITLLKAKLEKGATYARNHSGTPPELWVFQAYNFGNFSYIDDELTLNAKDYEGMDPISAFQKAAEVMHKRYDGSGEVRRPDPNAPCNKDCYGDPNYGVNALKILTKILTAMPTPQAPTIQEIRAEQRRIFKLLMIEQY